jgi:hypothetical protein
MYPARFEVRSMRRRVVTAALATTALIAVVTAATPAAVGATSSGGSGTSSPGSIGIRLLDAPNSERGNPRARLYIIDQLRPGTVIHRRIAVSNTTNKTVRPEIYPAAATIENGTFVGQPGKSRSELTSWIDVHTKVLTVAPATSAVDTVTITVPNTASRGERYGVIWAQVTSPPHNPTTVTIVNRVGIRVYLSIGPGGAPPSAFDIDSLTAKRSADHKPWVVAMVHNTGERALDISGTLHLDHGPGGLSAGPFPARLGTTLAPGDVEPVTIPLSRQIPDGPWHARLALRSGFTHRTAIATIRFPRNAGATTVDTPRGNPTPERWFVLAGALLAALLLLLVVIGVRRRSQRSASV